MISMKLKDVHWTKYIQKKQCYLKMTNADIFINLANNMEIKKDKPQTLNGVDGR